MRDFSGKKILVLGSNGQVGRALRLELQNIKTNEVVFAKRDDCDLTDKNQVRSYLDEVNPDFIINAAAYTQVDLAQTNEKAALELNRDLPDVLAQYLRVKRSGLLIHFSTDYVFSGEQPRPYSEVDACLPQSIYGQSKWAGEAAIIKTLCESDIRYYILRTSWVYGDGKNFIKTILQFAQTKNILRIVADQLGAPTAAHWLAEVTLMFLKFQPAAGIYHTVPDGVISWHGLAQYVLDWWDDSHPSQSRTICNPIMTEDYPSPAPRPMNSRLNHEKLKNFWDSSCRRPYPIWQTQVENYLQWLSQCS